MRFTPENINQWCNERIGKSLLSLIYPDDWDILVGNDFVVVSLINYEIQGQNRANLLRQGFQNAVRNNEHLIFAIALPVDSVEYENYQANDFEQWTATLSSEFMQKHCLPEYNPDLYAMNENALIELGLQRRQLLSARLLQIYQPII